MPVAAPRKGTTEPYLCGTYACYSLAWSPYYQDHLIGGELTIGPEARQSVLTASYTENLLSQAVTFEGDLRLAGRTVHIGLRECSAGSPLFMTMFLPGLPASVLCGVMSGATFMGPEALPSATRLVAYASPGQSGHQSLLSAAARSRC